MSRGQYKIQGLGEPRSRTRTTRSRPRTSQTCPRGQGCPRGLHHWYIIPKQDGSGLILYSVHICLCTVLICLYCNYLDNFDTCYFVHLVLSLVVGLLELYNMFFFVPIFKRSQKIIDHNIYSFMITGKSIKSSADTTWNYLLNVQLDERHISTSHRLKQNEEDTRQHPPIIVRFTNRDKRNEIFRKRKMLQTNQFTRESINSKFGNANLKITENLTRYRKTLFNTAKLANQHLHYKFLWTSQGQIRLRQYPNSRIITVTSLSDLNKIGYSGPVAGNTGAKYYELRRNIKKN